MLSEAGVETSKSDFSAALAMLTPLEMTHGSI